MSDPAGCSIPTSRQQAHLPRGGNLARVNTQNAGHSSLLRQLADDLRADGSDRDEAWASLRARGAGAAIHRHILRCAESHPPSLLQADDVAHKHFSDWHWGKYRGTHLIGRKSLPELGIR